MLAESCPLCDELWLITFAKLGLSDLARVQCSSSHLAGLAFEDAVLQTAVRRQFPDVAAIKVRDFAALSWREFLKRVGPTVRWLKRGERFGARLPQRGWILSLSSRLFQIGQELHDGARKMALIASAYGGLMLWNMSPSDLDLGAAMTSPIGLAAGALVVCPFVLKGAAALLENLVSRRLSEGELLSRRYSDQDLRQAFLEAMGSQKRLATALIIRAASRERCERGSPLGV